MYVTVKTHPYQSLTTFDRCLMRITANTFLFSVTGGHVQHPAEYPDFFSTQKFKKSGRAGTII
jgi:hypothetical protein